MAEQIDQETVHLIATGLVHIQRGLLNKGYEFAAGYAEHWPFPYVVMSKGDDLLVIAPWWGKLEDITQDVWGNISGQGDIRRGLVLVGVDEDADSVVDSCMGPRGGGVGYLNANNGHFAVRAGKGSAKMINERSFRGFAKPGFPGAITPELCKARLDEGLRDVEERHQFFAKADRASKLKGPMVTYTIIAACIICYLAMMLRFGLGLMQSPDRDMLFNLGALHGPSVKAGQWWRLVTCALLHGGIFHIGMNMYALYNFGMLIERLQGWARLGVVFAFSVITASAASIFWRPGGLSVGASGGLFGLVGFMAALTVRYYKTFPPQMRLALRSSLVNIIILNAAMLFIPFIDGAAHVGGLIGGFILGLALVRSPIKDEKLKSWNWLGIAAAVAAAGVFLAVAVMRV